MENKLIITEFIEDVFDGIEKDASSKNQKIPVKSFRTEATNEGGEGYAATHFKYLVKDQGSAPGKMRPVEPFLNFIISENIQPSPRENKDGTFSKTTQESLAWAMAYSQSKNGSLIYQGKKPGVDLKGVLTEKTPIFLSKIAKNLAASIATVLRNATIIIFITVLLGACGSRVPVKHDSKKIKKERTITVGQTFLMVGCFMLGYGLTNEYLIKE